ncbi:TPA: Gfo/Idh/MocA family oxidoreductase [Candidatus Bathyarchaeota archaeon]|nr:Gfo/Idh/MocA family oxidoreductase [Candidatus Bathyarchaeota archaeon]
MMNKVQSSIRVTKKTSHELKERFIDPIGIAVIGCGNIARAHLNALMQLSYFKLIATVDIYAEKAKEYAEEYNAEKFYTSYVDALEDPDVEAVSICLPHSLHAQVAVEAAKREKHVLTEKPMAISLGDAVKMVSIAERKGVTLMVEQTLRFRECNAQVRKIIMDGVIGKPCHVIRRRLGYSKSAQVTWANKPNIAGGWVLYGFGSHEVDIALWHLGGRAWKVYAQGSINNSYWNDYDEVSVHMELKDGVIVTVHMSLNCLQHCWDSIIIGTKGSIMVREAIDVTVNKKVISTPLKPSEGIMAALKEFASAIREEREPEASGRDVLKTMWALEAAKISLREGEVITEKDLPYPSI